MTDFHLKTRIDMIVERPFLSTLTDLLDRAGTPGYSVLPVLEGRGMTNAWTSDGQISNASSMVAVFCIVDATLVDRLVTSVMSAIRDRIGFMTISDVKVIRSERF